MDIGIPKETGAREHRVALTPSGVKALVQQGARVWVQRGAGCDAGFSDDDYASAGAATAYSREEVFQRTELVVAIHPPSATEHPLMQPGQIVLANWALPAARPEDVRSLLARGVTAVGLEILENEQGRATIQVSMSEIAGSLAVTIGAGLLLNEFGGKGILFSAAPSVPAASIVILGTGVLGLAAARAAVGLGAHVVLLDRSVDRLRYAMGHVGQAIPTMLASGPNLEKVMSFADLLLCAVAVRGERAPMLITRDMLGLMRPRSVIMDLSIDMGGCCETSRPTSFPNPTYEVDGILHFCVPNLPSVAARSSTLALTNELLPYLLEVVSKGFEVAFRENRGLCRGVYIRDGSCRRESLARIFGEAYVPPPCAG